MSAVQDPYILMLDGYLRCIATLCGPKFAFSASAFKDPRDIDVFVEEHVREWRQGDEYLPPSEYTYVGRDVIDYKSLRKEIAAFVFEGDLKALSTETEGTQSTGSALLWRLFEYYGLASTSLNENGPFHPLVRGPVYRLDIRSPLDVRALYYLVSIESIHVLTAFLEKEVGAMET